MKRDSQNYKPLYPLPDTGILVGWPTYREETGECELCGQIMAQHSKCEACALLVGGNHLSGSAIDYRGHKICGWCRRNWGMLDLVTGKETTWEAFVKPSKYNPAASKR